MQHTSKDAVSCADCAFLQDCGGLSEPGLWGCFTQCFTTCDPECDLTCPYRLRLFAERLDEIGGVVTYSASRLLAPTLPFAPYIPKIHNGSSREEKLRIPQVVIPGRELISISGKDVSCRFRIPREVRNHFCLSDRTAYIVSCITNDNDVEATWHGLKYGGLAKDIARLKPAAVIVPNFSFFIEDVPRTHILYNRKRIAQAAEILSAIGCPVILPLNALTPNDWEFWFSLLRENPTMTYVAKAFQTGLKKRTTALRAIEDLSKLQEILGRPLHPVALSGGPHVTMLNKYFNTYTVVDSRPFMSTVKRRRLVWSDSCKCTGVPALTLPGELLDELMWENLQTYSMHFNN